MFYSNEVQTILNTINNADDLYDLIKSLLNSSRYERDEVLKMIEEAKNFYSSATEKAKANGLKIKWIYAISHKKITENIGFEHTLQFMNYASNGGVAYYTLLGLEYMDTLKIEPKFANKKEQLLDSDNKEIYIKNNKKLVTIKCKKGDGYSLTQYQVEVPTFVLHQKDFQQYSEERLNDKSKISNTALEYLDYVHTLAKYYKVFGNLYNYIIHFLNKGFALEEIHSSSYWGRAFEGSEGIGLQTYYRDEYSTGDGYRAGKQYFFYLAKEVEKRLINNKQMTVYKNEKGTSFVWYFFGGNVASFAKIIFSKIDC